MKAAKAALLFLLFVGVCYVGIFFANQNGELLTIQLFHWASPAWPKWQVLLSALSLGALVSTLIFGIQLIVLETRIVRLRRANQKLERALHASQTQASNGVGAALPTTDRPTTAISPLEDDV